MFKRFRVPVSIGIFPMKSYGVAKGLDKFVPEVSVPQELLDKLKNVKQIAQSKEDRNPSSNRWENI